MKSKKGGLILHEA